MQVRGLQLPPSPVSFSPSWISTGPGGKLTAVNAGHEYPVYKAPGGCYELIRDRHGIAVGALENVRYREYELSLEPGSSLFVYTDGLPEANDSQTELFGPDRMLAALNRDPELGPEETLRAVQASVDAFVGEAAQFDDLTMMCLQYHGPAGQDACTAAEAEGQDV